MSFYPSVRYGEDGRQRIVRSQAESDTLGPGWSDTPATWLTTTTTPDPQVVTVPEPVKPKHHGGRPKGSKNKVKADV